MLANKMPEVCCVKENLGMRFKHISNLVEKKAYSLFSSDGYPFVSQSGFSLLDFLYCNQDKEITQKDIETELVINRATTSKMLVQLEQKGLILRSDSKTDARKKTVTLTEYGKKLRNRNKEKQAEFDRIMTASLSEEDLEAFDRIYDKLRETLDE